MAEKKIIKLINTREGSFNGTPKNGIIEVAEDQADQYLVNGFKVFNGETGVAEDNADATNLEEMTKKDLTAECVKLGYTPKSSETKEDLIEKLKELKAGNNTELTDEEKAALEE